jgi:hypothetical protein
VRRLAASKYTRSLVMRSPSKKNTAITGTRNALPVGGRP